MPTENRSSNIEMVSVPREWLNSVALLQMPLDELQEQAIQHLCEPCDEPAPQPHPEPIAWMVGTAIWWTKEEAERDAAAMGLPVVTLGPCAGLGDHERLRTELVESDLAFVRAATEAEQLRAKLAERDALLRDIASGYWELAIELPADLLVRLQALSASAEPSVPGKQGAPLGAVRAPEIQNLLDRAATAIGQYGDSLLGRGQREDSVDLLDLEREVRDLEQQFKGAFAQPST
ncbi:hypothetical protein LOY24_18110 [Pseudomonas putida]|uniref:hypothetical protein n=1 Tax=Pseudomonas putida TaxID=303 RepID=UPI00215FDF11|nr:hypothetical protein [Pseudomonas putida]UVL76640.1 hypothetical protein LOY24_18110 [Pseudomonas putida]